MTIKPCPKCIGGQMLSALDLEAGHIEQCLQCGYVKPPENPLPLVMDAGGRPAGRGGTHKAKSKLRERE